MSRKQIYRYIRLNELIAELQEWVDKSIITIEAAVELSFISEEKQHIILEHINGLGIAVSVITRHFKVAMTKKIHTVADSVSDEEFSANIDKIIFSVYEAKTTAPTVQVGLEVPLPPTNDEKKSGIIPEQSAPIKEKKTAPTAQVGLEVPLPPTKDEKQSEIIPEQSAPTKEKKTVPTAQVGLEVPLPAVAEKKKAIVVTEQPDPTAPEAQNELKNILSASKNGQPIKFRDEEHERNYNFILDMMPYSDIERKALAYLFALDTVCFEHIRDLYDFSDNRIMLSGLEKDWQTGTSKRTTRLAFNLYNSYCSDGETYIDSDGIEDSLPSACYSPAYLFCCEYAKYYVEALKIRFPEWFL